MARAAVIAGFVVEAETAKVGWMWKEFVVVVVVVFAAAAAAAISVAIVSGVVALRGFAVTFEWQLAAVALSVAGFVATTAVEIFAIVSAVVAAASVRD